MVYPFSVLNDTPVVNDVVGGIPTLMIFNAPTGTGVMYDRRIRVELLTLDSGEWHTLTDAETGTQGDGMSGEAFSELLTDHVLTRLMSTSSFL